MHERSVLGHPCATSPPGWNSRHPQVRLVIADEHAGLAAAVRRFLPEAERQRCSVHLQRNVLTKVPHRLRKRLAREVSPLFKADGLTEAKKRRDELVARWSKELPEAMEVLTRGFAAATRFYAFPKAHWPRIRTTNGLERLHGEIKRRIRAVGAFPDRASALRLITAVALRRTESWADRRYVDLSLLDSEEGSPRQFKRTQPRELPLSLLHTNRDLTRIRASRHSERGLTTGDGEDWNDEGRRLALEQGGEGRSHRRRRLLDLEKRVGVLRGAVRRSAASDNKHVAPTPRDARLRGTPVQYMAEPAGGRESIADSSLVETRGRAGVATLGTLWEMAPQAVTMDQTGTLGLLREYAS